MAQVLEVGSAALALLFSYFLSLFVFGLPALVVASIGWWFSRRLRNVRMRAALRAGLVSLVIAPIPYGHTGFVPAIYALFFPTLFGTAPWGPGPALLIGWLVAFALITWIERPVKPEKQIGNAVGR